MDRGNGEVRTKNKQLKMQNHDYNQINFKKAKKKSLQNCLYSILSFEYLI